MSVTRRIRHLVVVAALLLIAACSTEGQLSESDDPSTSPGEETTTTAEDGDSDDGDSDDGDREDGDSEDGGSDGNGQTDDDYDGGETPSLEELQSALPEAEEIGPVWSEVDDSNESLSEEQIEDCPDLAQYLSDEDDERAERSYEDDEGFRFSLSYGLDPGTLAEEDGAEQMIEDYEDCDLEFEDDGIEYSMTFVGRSLSEAGRNGVMVTGNVTATDGNEEIEFQTHSLGAVSDNGVRVNIGTQDVIEDDGQVSPVNEELFPPLLSEILVELEAL